MSVESFQFRYPLNRNPYVADQSSPIIYPYSRFASLETNPNLYVYGRQLPFRSYFGEDMNLSARPISRTIQPAILEYRPMSDNAKKDSCEPVAVTMVPVLNNRFVTSLPGQTEDDLDQWLIKNGIIGAQVNQTNSKKMFVIIAALGLLSVMGFLFWKRMKKTKQE